MSDGEDNIDAQLADLESRAPLTEEPEEGAQDREDASVADPEAAAAEKKTADETPARAPLSPEELAQRHDQVRTALREERAQRRAERAEFLAKQEKLEQAFQRVQESLRAPPRQQAETPPQLTYEDAVAEMWHRQQQQDQWERQQHAQSQQQAAQQQENARAIAQLQSTMGEYEADFRDEAPDYDDAIKHLTATWDSQFEMMGYAPDQRQALINNLSVNAVHTALTAGRDPAKAIYEAAKRAGYAAKPAAATGAEKLSQIQAGQAASKTLSGGGSGVQGEGLSLKHLASLEGAAFDAAMEKLRKSAR